MSDDERRRAFDLRPASGGMSDVESFDPPIIVRVRERVVLEADDEEFLFEEDSTFEIIEKGNLGYNPDWPSVQLAPGDPLGILPVQVFTDLVLTGSFVIVYHPKWGFLTEDDDQ